MIEGVKNQRKAGALLSYVYLVLNVLVGFIYTPFMLRQLGQSEYGIYTIANSVIGYLSMLDLGFGNAMIRYTAKYRALKDKGSEYRMNGMFLVLYSCIGALALLIGAYVSFNVGGFFPRFSAQEVPTASIVFLIMVANLAASFPLSIFTAIITAYEEFIFPKTIAIIRTVLLPCLMIPLLLNGFRSIAMVTVMTVLNLTALLLNVWFCFHKLKIKIVVKRFDPSLLKEIIRYSFFILLAIVVDQVNLSTDQLILGAISGTAVAAVYGIAIQLYNYYISFSTAISGVFLPKLSKMNAVKGTSSEVSDLFVRVSRIQFLLMSLILTGFILFGRQFVIVWGGTNYEPAYLVCVILMVPAIIPLSQNVGIAILQSQNRHQFRALVYVGIAVLNVMISIPLAYVWGGIGTAVGTSVATILGQGFIMNWYYYKKIQLDIPAYWHEIGKISIPALIVFLFGLGMQKVLPLPGVKGLMVGIAAYVVLYAAVMWKFVMNSYEKGLVQSVLHKITARR